MLPSEVKEAPVYVDSPPRCKFVAELDRWDTIGTFCPVEVGRALDSGLVNEGLPWKTDDGDAISWLP